jgi:hypothetical protein
VSELELLPPLQVSLIINTRTVRVFSSQVALPSLALAVSALEWELVTLVLSALPTAVLETLTLLASTSHTPVTTTSSRLVVFTTTP